MNAMQITGLVLVASPFVIGTAWVIYEDGVAIAAQVWGMTILVCGVIGGGIAVVYQFGGE